MTEKTDTGTTLVDGGFLMWTYGADVNKRMGWQRAKWNYAAAKGVVLILDGGNNLRRVYYPDYKIRRRTKLEDDPIRQMRQRSVREFRELVLEPDPVLNIVKFEGLEADDVIAAFCIRHPDYLRVIGTDKDLVQLGKRNLRLKDHKGQVITLEKFRASLPKTLQPFIDAPEKILLAIALLGDKSDSIPRLVPSGLSSLKQFARIVQEPDAWNLAVQEYDQGEVMRNLYLSILPGPWVWDQVPSPEEVLAHMMFDPSHYFNQKLRPDIEEAYTEKVFLRKSAEELTEELGF